MKTLIDKDNSLTWTAYNLSGDKLDDSKEDMQTLEKINSELDTWRSPEISTYIDSTRPIGRLFSSLLKNSHGKSCHQFCAYDKGKLVASVLISSKLYLYEKIPLKSYIQDEAFHPDLETFISKEFAREILENNTDENNACINYLVVNPQMSNRGIGTRVVRSITSNLPFFVPDKNNNAITTYVSEHNEPSKKVFAKNGFKIVKPCKNFITEVKKGHRHDIYFFVPREKRHLDDLEQS